MDLGQVPTLPGVVLLGLPAAAFLVLSSESSPLPIAHDPPWAWLQPTPCCQAVRGGPASSVTLLRASPTLPLGPCWGQEVRRCSKKQSLEAAPPTQAIVHVPISSTWPHLLQ